MDADQAARDAAAGGDACPLAPSADDILLLADARTAVLPFLHDHDHDHDRDVGIIAAALRGPACHVGALGKRRVAAERLRRQLAAGIAPDRLARFHAPVGLVPSTRDPRGLAISILAEIVALDLASLDCEAALPATRPCRTDRSTGAPQPQSGRPGL